MIQIVNQDVVRKAARLGAAVERARLAVGEISHAQIACGAAGSPPELCVARVDACKRLKLARQALRKFLKEVSA